MKFLGLTEIIFEPKILGSFQIGDIKWEFPFEKNNLDLDKILKGMAKVISKFTSKYLGVKSCRVCM